MNQKIRFGIIGCSNIAKSSVLPAMKKSKNVILEHIGSRSEEKAKNFSDEFGCKKFGSYNDVLNDEDVDAVYISTPISTHEEWIAKSANSRKHILCEKSSVDTFSSAKKSIKVCNDNDVRLMEGFMFRFHPSHRKVKELIQQKKLGKISLFSSKYGFPPISKNNIRYNKSLGGGILNDAGCYPICASRIIFGSEPIGISCEQQIDKEHEVDTKTSLFMKFNNSQISQSFVAYDMSYQSTYSIWGSEGHLQLTRAYNVPSDMNVNLEINSSTINEKISIDPVNHFEIMIDSFCSELITPGSSSFNFEEDLLNQAKSMEAARLSFKENRYVEINELQ
jgi:predicted dehydrogenase